MRLLTIQNLSLIQTYRPMLKSNDQYKFSINYTSIFINIQNSHECNSGRQQAAKASIAASTGSSPGAQQAPLLTRNTLMTKKYGPLCPMEVK
jgi:hypothetical protein